MQLDRFPQSGVAFRSASQKHATMQQFASDRPDFSFVHGFCIEPGGTPPSNHALIPP